MRDHLQEFHDYVATPSDINEHLDRLYWLALECPRITEFGVGFGRSTRAFIAALIQNKLNFPQAWLRSYDIVKHEGVEELFIDAQEAGLDAQLIYHDTITADVEETDLLLVDSHHVYEQVIGELQNHGNKVQKYIAFHDTELYGLIGQDPGSVGILPAINEFLDANPHWVIKEQHTKNNGLWIVERKI